MSKQLILGRDINLPYIVAIIVVDVIQQRRLNDRNAPSSATLRPS